MYCLYLLNSYVCDVVTTYGNLWQLSFSNCRVTFQTFNRSPLKSSFLVCDLLGINIFGCKRVKNIYANCWQSKSVPIWRTAFSDIVWVDSTPSQFVIQFLLFFWTDGPWQRRRKPKNKKWTSTFFHLTPKVTVLIQTYAWLRQILINSYHCLWIILFNDFAELGL